MFLPPSKFPDPLIISYWKTAFTTPWVPVWQGFLWNKFMDTSEAWADSRHKTETCSPFSVLGLREAQGPRVPSEDTVCWNDSGAKPRPYKP